MLARMRAAIGETAQLAARAALSTQERRSVRTWLLPLEAMARKIALMHALKLLEKGHTRGDTPAGAAPAKTPPSSAMRVCHPANPAPPALTLITLPPSPVRVITHAAALPAAAPRQQVRTPSLRLWPRASAGAGPRVRDVGPNLLVREVRRDEVRFAMARRMQSLRAMRRPEPERLARRIDALARLIERPLAAARRLARRLVLDPLLALRLSAKRAPRATFDPEPEYDLVHSRVSEDAWAFNAKLCDTS